MAALDAAEVPRRTWAGDARDPGPGTVLWT
jgi:hypothetical protein